MSLKTCPGFGLDTPHEEAKTAENFRLSADGRTTKSPYCRTHETDYDRARPGTGMGDTTGRKAEGKGVYLGVLKLADLSYLTKPGKTGDRRIGFRTRAGLLATNARAVGLDVVHAEILHVIDISDADNRSAAEAILLGIAEPIHGTEYFKGTDFPTFAYTFEAIGRPYTERTTYAARYAEFMAWLARELGKWNA